MTDRYQKMLERLDTLAETERERRLMRYAAEEGASVLWLAVCIGGESIGDAERRISDACNDLTREVWADALAEMREAE